MQLSVYVRVYVQNSVPGKGFIVQSVLNGTELESIGGSEVISPYLKLDNLYLLHRHTPKRGRKRQL